MKNMSEWLCKYCNTTFTPSGSDYRCPTCGSSATIPKNRPVPSETKREKTTKLCTRCGAEMMEGFTVQTDGVLQLTTIGAGVYWSPSETGPLFSRVPLKSFLCPACGFVETYARYEGEKGEEPFKGSRAYCINCKKYVEVNPGQTMPVYKMKCPECGRSGMLSKSPEDRKKETKPS